MKTLDVTWKGSKAFVGTFVRGFQAALAGRPQFENPYQAGCNKGFGKAWHLGLEQGRKWVAEHIGVGDPEWVKMECQTALGTPDKDGNVKCPFIAEQVKAMSKLYGVMANCPNCYSQGNVKECLERMLGTWDEDDKPA